MVAHIAASGYPFKLIGSHSSEPHLNRNKFVIIDLVFIEYCVWMR